jgi:hypothetical protein
VTNATLGFLFTAAMASILVFAESRRGLFSAVVVNILKESILLIRSVR